MILLMLCLTACDRPSVVAIPVAPDTAPLQSCPRDYVIPPKLEALEKFTLPDGRAAYLADVVTSNNTKTARFVVQGRDHWALCKSAVEYAEDALKKGSQTP